MAWYRVLHAQALFRSLAAAAGKYVAGFRLGGRASLSGSNLCAARRDREGPRGCGGNATAYPGIYYRRRGSAPELLQSRGRRALHWRLAIGRIAGIVPVPLVRSWHSTVSLCKCTDFLLLGGQLPWQRRAATPEVDPTRKKSPWRRQVAGMSDSPWGLSALTSGSRN